MAHYSWSLEPKFMSFSKMQSRHKPLYPVLMFTGIINTNLFNKIFSRGFFFYVYTFFFIRNLHVEPSKNIFSRGYLLLTTWQEILMGDRSFLDEIFFLVNLKKYIIFSIIVNPEKELVTYGLTFLWFFYFLMGIQVF